MPKYLVLIHGEEQKWIEATPQWRERNDAGHRAFAAQAGAAVLDGRELAATSKTTSLRVDAQGRRLVTDGPYAETKEVIGGYYLLEADDLEDAVRLAWLIPEATTGHSGVEVRPIVEPG